MRERMDGRIGNELNSHMDDAREIICLGLVHKNVVRFGIIPDGHPIRKCL